MIPLVKPFIPDRDILMPAIEKVLYSGYIAEGDNVIEFEKEISLLLGNPYSLAVNSGTSALHIALMLLNIKKGDEVISTALTAEPTNTVIAITGAKVVFADVDINNGLIDPNSIRERITSKTKAIMVVHYAGMVCNMDEINRISKELDIPVIEDAAHAFLSKYNNQYVGNNSRFTCFSFQAIKHMTTVDGGLICFKNKEDYDAARKLRWFGLDKKIPRLENNIVIPGYKYNMNNLNAAIGQVQLKTTVEIVNRHIENGRYFDQNLLGIQDLELVKYYPNTCASYWLYTVKVKERGKFIAHLEKNGISASPLHLRNDRHDVFHHSLSLKNLDSFYQEFVHIPCGWWVTNEDRKFIVKVIKEGWR